MNRTRDVAMAALASARRQLETAEAELQRLQDDKISHVFIARRILATRQVRARYVPTAWIGEPAWDLLLGLYIARAEGRGLTVSDLAKTAVLSANVTRKWVDQLEKSGWVTRTSPSGKKVLIALAEDAANTMDRLLTDFGEHEASGRFAERKRRG